MSLHIIRLVIAVIAFSLCVWAGEFFWAVLALLIGAYFARLLQFAVRARVEQHTWSN